MNWISTLCGFFLFLFLLAPPRFERRRPAGTAAPDPDSERATLIFLTVVAVLMVAWATTNKNPWQLDVLFFVALGWRLLPSAIRQRINKHNGHDDDAIAVNLTGAPKENTAQ